MFKILIISLAAFLLPDTVEKEKASPAPVSDIIYTQQSSCSDASVSSASFKLLYWDLSPIIGPVCAFDCIIGNPCCQVIIVE